MEHYLQCPICKYNIFLQLVRTLRLEYEFFILEKIQCMRNICKSKKTRILCKKTIVNYVTLTMWRAGHLRANNQIVSTIGCCVTLEAKPLPVISEAKLIATFRPQITFLRPFASRLSQSTSRKRTPSSQFRKEENFQLRLLLGLREKEGTRQTGIEMGHSRP